MVLDDDTEPSGSLAVLQSDRYELIELIGSGSMGLVYRARDRVSGRHVALKTRPHTSPEDVFRLKREFRSFARVAHPNLVRLYELVAEGDRCFFTMELIEDALPLTDHLRLRATATGRSDGSPAVRGSPPAIAVRDAFRQLALGLERVHREDKVHRDVKPTNVLVDGKGRVVLLDFGLFGGLESRISKLSIRESLVGTAAYMSPEQAWGRDLSPASDWYSFGVMLYEVLTGQSPFESASLHELFDRARVQIPSPESVRPDCPPDLAALAMALLAVEPEERPDAEVVLSALGGDASASPASRVPPWSASARSPFVGRTKETDLLWTALEAARVARAAVVTIEGPSGIGKSRLVEQFMLDRAPPEALLLRSRCYPYEAVPFGALDEVVDELSRFLEVGTDDLASFLPRDTAALGTVFPVLARLDLPMQTGTSPNAEPAEVRRRGFQALAELLGRVAVLQPLIVWVDDLQWSDTDSEPLLRELLRSPDARGLLWVFTYRSEDRSESRVIASVEQQLADLTDVSHHAIRLGPLADAECRALVESMSAEPALAPDAIEAISRASGGSPFLLTEIARHGDPGSGPRGVDFGSVLARRFGALPDSSRRLVETVVVAGGPLERSLALQASGLEDFDPDLVAGLERDRILRTTSGDARPSLEVYHARIRESIESRLPPETLRARHCDIARTLEERESPDVFALYGHFRAGGELRRAAGYALRAGDQAAAQLAFDQAAQLYRAALELAPGAVDPRYACTRLAESLANAGRGGESAVAFSDAAAHALEAKDRAGVLSLRCRAAEQLLLSGRIDEGTRLLQPMFDDIGIRWPETTARALRGTLTRLPGLALRYAFARPRDDGRVSPDAGLLTDACHVATKGMIVVDPVRAAYFSVRALSTALGAGDPKRTGRALGAVAVALVPLGGPIGAWARHMLRRARKIGVQTGDPYLRAIAYTCGAEAHFVEGRWLEMLADCDEGIALLRENCRGVRWECTAGEMAALRALEELGRIPELRERLGRLTEEADALDDRYAQVTFSLYEGLWTIAAGDPARARALSRDGLARWDHPSDHLQHLYGLRIEAFCDLYEGDPDGAWQRVLDTWPAIRKANLLRHPLLRTDAYGLRACTAIALAAARPGDEALLRDASHAARVLDRAGRPDSMAAAALIRAGIAHLRDDRKQAIALLGRAEQGYVGGDMPLHASYARRRRGEVVGGEAGRAATHDADRVLVDRGIAAPERWLALVAPGFRGTK
jgi:hypothetical protein